MYQLTLNKRNFGSSYAHLSNVRAISAYSMTVDREVIIDRSSARYLISENINDNVDFDLKKGIDTFINRIELLKDEGRLHPFCKWACAQEGDDLKELFCGAQFAGSRGTMRLIAMTIMIHNPPRFVKPENAWTVIAVKTGDVILLCEKSKKYEEVNAMGTYSGFKFEQHMTSDKPQGEAFTDVPVDNRAVFKKMIRCDISLEGQSIGICGAAEVDAIDGDSSIELQTRQITREFGFFPSLKMVLQSELADVHSAVIGWKTEDLVVKKVTRVPISSFKPILKRSDENALAFLFSVLRYTQNMLTKCAWRNACEISYVPLKGIVEFNDFPKEEAMDLLTPEFKKKFNLGD